MINHKQKALEENRQCYERLYHDHSSFKHFLRMFLSFDQQSKAKLNKLYLQSTVKLNRERSAAGPINVLDYGCGWGASLMRMPRQFKLYCYDLSDAAMAMVCQSLGRIGYKVSPATISESELVEPENTHIIICSHVLEHVEDDQKLLELFYSSLNVDGVLLINVPINEAWNDPKHVRQYTQDSLIARLRGVGFLRISANQADKWTGFLIEKEFLSGEISSLRKVILRICRGLLAIMPLALIRLSEEVFFRARPYQQLIVIAEKA